MMKLWENALFYTMENEYEYYNKIITKDGIILEVGDKCDYIEVDEIIDLNNAFVFPGFTDAHIHLIGYGRKLNTNNLNQEKDKKDVLRKIKNFYNNENLKIEGYFDINITKNDLDLISTDHFIILRHNDYHSFTVNSKTLNLLNINHESGIIKDEQICNKILPLWSNYTKEELSKYTKDAILKLYEFGITNVHTDDLSYFNSYSETLEVLDNVSLKYPIRINELINYEIYNDYKLSDFENLKYINPAQIKLFYDGTISSKTALIKENYKNHSNNGIRTINKESFEEIVKRIKNNNEGVAIHTIGDLALEEVSEILSKYQTNYKDRIVHASLASKKAINTLSSLNIALDIQPLFIKSDQETIKNSINHTPLIYPFYEYKKNNILLNGSSDAPVEDPNPLLSIYLLNDLSRFDAISLYTKNPSVTINSNSGLIKKGYLADFTVYKENILTIANNDLLITNPQFTIVNGEFVYKKAL